MKRATEGGGAKSMAVAPAVPSHRVRIEPRSSAFDLHLREVWAFRDLLALLAVRDVKLRYRQTLLGAAWVVLLPLVSAGIFAFVFGEVAGLPTNGVPYFILVFAGLSAWNLFSNILSRVSISLVGNAPLVSKVYFPRLVLPVATLLSAIVDFAVTIVVLGVMVTAQGVPVTARVLYAPLFVALIVCFALGVGLVAAAWNVRYRDVQLVLAVVIQLLLYASPVAYTAAAVPARYRTVYFLNPMSGLLEGFRTSVLGPFEFDAGHAAYGAVAAIVTLGVGLLVFNRAQRRFADVI